MDHIEEDFNRTPARATGFHGKMSEVTWMQKLKKQVFHGSDDGEEEEHGSWVDGQTSPAFQADHYSSGLPRISDSTYHCDNMSVQMPDQIDPFETPTQETADLLFQSYLETVHPSFPIIGKSTFVNQYQAFLVSKDQSKINKNWLSILNLIFAIGAKYSHLVQSAWRGDKRDHFLYFTRARVLGFNSEAILGHAELQKVQITGLITFYLMSIDQINRYVHSHPFRRTHKCNLDALR